MVLEADLTLTFWVKPEVMAQYSDVRVEFQIGDKTTVVTDYRLNDRNRSGFDCTGISPKMIKDSISATIYGTYDGVEYSYTKIYSGYEYLYPLLEDNNAKLSAVVVDLLNYGALHQIYTGYKTNALVNADLTEAEKALGTTTAPSLQTIQNTKQEVIDNPVAKFVGVTLYLQNAVVVRLTLKCEDLTDVAVKFVVEGKEFTVDAADMVPVAGYTDRYYVYFTGLRASQLRASVDATACRNGVAISNTLRYSVESYAFDNQNATANRLGELVKSIITYGDSVYAYSRG